MLGCASFTPSLIPRPWYVQGAVAGLSAVAGYALGVFLVWLVHLVSGWTPSPTLVRRLWIVLACLGIPFLTWSMWMGQRWQREIHLLTHVPPPVSYSWISILLLSVSLVLVAVALARVIRWTVRGLSRRLVLHMPNRFAQPVAVLIVAVALVLVNNGLVWRGLVGTANSISGGMNGTTNAGTFRPESPARSGSPASLISWGSLGRQGRDFVALGPTEQDLRAFWGAPAEMPVRVYAGLSSAPSTRQRAALAVRDLERAGAFDRAVLVVTTTTGTGLADPAASEALEYMYRGDTAIVALQYSYLPSFISVLVDHEKAEEAGRELFNQVYDAWSKMPRADRPQLLVTGTSEGAFGSEAAFGGLADIQQRTDGVVWAGAPNFSALHHMFVQRRDPGTPEWQPTYDSGRAVRFASRPADLWKPTGEWERPRIVYLQNGSDPVVYWTPQLLFSKPDWLSEARPPDVSSRMFWIPIVTFWQVSADLPSTYYVPAGHGHRYLSLYVDAWAAVAPPPRWTDDDTRRVRVQLQKNQRKREALTSSLTSSAQ